MYTVKQLSDLAGVSVRTLHYYDEIGLLAPTKVGTNGYRYYDDEGLFRLQQILLYREIGLELAQIKDILDRPDFDLLAALREHRAALQEQIDHLRELVATIDTTLLYLTGEADMSKKALFEAFSDEKQKHYERVARLQWGPEIVNESVRRWNGYTQAQKDAIRAEGSQIYTNLAEALEAGKSAHSAEVQAILRRWHNHLRHFYEPTTDILRGLGEGYRSHPDFVAFFTRLHPDLPDYLAEAITQYVDDLEDAELRRLIAEDAVQQAGE